MGRSLHNKIRLGRRAALYNIRRAQTAAALGMSVGAGLIVLVFKAL